MRFFTIRSKNVQKLLVSYILNVFRVIRVKKCRAFLYDSRIIKSHDDRTNGHVFWDVSYKRLVFNRSIKMRVVKCFYFYIFV